MGSGEAKFETAAIFSFADGKAKSSVSWFRVEFHAVLSTQDSLDKGRLG